MTTFLAPAKINLFLHVVGRRTDGYHELRTFFQFIDLMDTVDITVNDRGVIERTSGLSAIPAKSDLVIKAAHLLREHVSDSRLGAKIAVTKNIPIGAGLGGGSSDAATTLLALNDRWDLQLDRDELAEIGLRLGADVPVFVHGHAGWASGVGEIIEPYSAPISIYVLVTPPVHVSTADVFASLHQPQLQITADSAVTAANPGNIDTVVDMPTDNDLEIVVRQHFVEVDQTFEWLAEYGQPQMSGSGGSVFLSVQNRAEAENILARLPAWWGPQWQCWVVQTLNHHPLNALQNTD